MHTNMARAPGYVGPRCSVGGINDGEGALFRRASNFRAQTLTFVGCTGPYVAGDANKVRFVFERRMVGGLGDLARGRRRFSTVALRRRGWKRERRGHSQPRQNTARRATRRPAEINEPEGLQAGKVDGR